MILTDPNFIAQLEMLALLTKRVLGGSLKADRASEKKGSGINFADYSEYKFGDDYRSIDWKVYGRLENLIVKMFEIEEDVAIYIFIDNSPSMLSKLEYTKKVAAALGYITLSNFDKLSLYSVNQQLSIIQQPCHGRNNIFAMLKALQDLSSTGVDTNLNNSIQEFIRRKYKKGVAVILSDFLIKSGFQSAIDQLRWYKHDVYCIQIQNYEDIDCDWKGDITLECIETKQERKITVSPLEILKYKEAIRNWNNSVKHYCAKNGVGFSYTLTDKPFENVIQYILRNGGLVS